MEEPDSKEKKHATKAVTSEPQEEFIEPKARPSQDKHDVPKEAPPTEQQ